MFSAAETTAMMLSLKVAGVATLVSLPFAVLTAWILAKKRFYGKLLLDALVHLPLVMPPVVTGYVLLLLFGRKGALGGFFESLGLVFSFRWTGAALAAGIMAFPLMVRAMRLGFQAVDTRLEAMAGTLGASPLIVFFTISLPLALPGLIAGMVLAFAKALGEFGATITFVANIPGETQTIPAAIYSAIQSPDGDGTAFRLAFISVLIAVLALLASEFLQRRLAYDRV